MRHRRKEKRTIMKHLVKKIKVCLVLAAAVLALSSISAMASEDDNSLSSLGILTEGAVVTPEFSYDTWSYEVSVPAGTTELQLDPVPSSASATITDISGTVLNEDGTGYVTITVLDLIAMRRSVTTRPAIFRNVIRPAAAAGIMGAATFFAAALLRNLTDSNTVVCLGALIAAVLVYVIFVIILRCITYEDCMLLPKGEKIAKILHIKQKT